MQSFIIKIFLCCLWFRPLNYFMLFTTSTQYALNSIDFLFFYFLLFLFLQRMTALIFWKHLTIKAIEFMQNECEMTFERNHELVPIEMLSGNIFIEILTITVMKTANWHIMTSWIYAIIGCYFFKIQKYLIWF